MKYKNQVVTKWVKAVMLFLVSCSIGLPTYAEEPDRPWDDERLIWFDEPAAEWRFGLPIGNGRLGAMMLGTYPKERIQLNEDSVWAKAPMVRHPVSTKDRIAEVQDLVDAGQYRAAHELYESRIIMAEAPRIGSYQTMGDLWIEHVGPAALNPSGYTRKLDLATGLVTVIKPLSDGSVVTEEVLSSAVDQCIAIRLTTTAADGLDFNVSMSRPFKRKPFAVVEGDDELLLDGQAHYETPEPSYFGTKFYTRLKLLPEGGAVKGGEGVLEVRGARAVTILLTCSTDFNRKQPQVPLRDGWRERAVDALAAAQRKSWTAIRDDSVRDLSSLMYRCDVDLGRSPSRLENLPTDQRLADFARSQYDPDLMELYFQFGRYLQVCSSRPGTLPTNLQGIWADGIRNPWNCDYHLNINTQLHYLSTEVTNLSECHEPLFWLLDMLRVEGRKMATSYGAKGFCTNHGVNPFGRALNGAARARWGGSVMSVHWVVMNIMERYRFTGDIDFLRETGFPILKESCEFLQSWVVRDPKTGKWVSRAGASPETGFTYVDEQGVERMSEIGPVTAYDQSIIRQVMSDYLEAAEILGISDAFTESVKATFAELETIRISERGHILEWGIEEATEVDRYHRHLSHLVGFHPGNQITGKKTPDLFEAARKSLIRRGDRNVGWSQCWKISCYARLFDGNAALRQFKQLLGKQTQPNLMNLAGNTMNLDGNYGAPAGVVEMILQSHDGEVHLLPALPDAWKSGMARGMVARGGFEVDLQWTRGRLVRAEIVSRNGGEFNIRYRDEVRRYRTKKGDRIVFEASSDFTGREKHESD